MKLSVYSLKKVLFQGEAELFNCKTAMGEITILDNHEPLIGVLTKGTIRLKDEKGQEHFFEVTSGFLEVLKTNEVRAIVD